MSSHEHVRLDEIGRPSHQIGDYRVNAVLSTRYKCRLIIAADFGLPDATVDHSSQQSGGVLAPAVGASESEYHPPGNSSQVSPADL